MMNKLFDSLKQLNSQKKKQINSKTNFERKLTLLRINLDERRALQMVMLMSLYNAQNKRNSRILAT